MTTLPHPRRRASDRLRGIDLLNNPALNKGTAFTAEERSRLGLHGLLPARVESLEEQLARAHAAFLHKDDDLERHIYLRALQDTNEVLFYRLLLEHPEEMLPIVYTPTVALGCQQFSHIYRRPRGLFIAYPQREAITALLRSRPHADVDVLVVTDGERVLGIGDQGVGGMGISIGKLSLYSLIGGIRPDRTLPVVLDVGTNNPERLADPEYLGWRHQRITGDDYFDFVDRFVSAVEAELPRACVQWEDLATPHARPILDRYRDRLLTFNDDIQGTAAVTLGALLAATQVTGRRLAEQQVVFLGAGSAAVGVADFLRAAMVDGGLSETEARARFWLVDQHGLLHDGRRDLSAQQAVYAQPLARVAGWRRAGEDRMGLATTVANVGPGILIGLSTAAGAFSEPIVRTMARGVERPIILPLSNPTERAEARAVDLLAWTEGRALVATGSPSAPVSYDGRTIAIAQCNNALIFPAVGLAAVATGARRVTDGMMLAAAHALAACSPARLDPAAALLPPVREVRRAAVEIAVAVGAAAQQAGVAPATSAATLRERVVAGQWTPAYPSDHG